MIAPKVQPLFRRTTALLLTGLAILVSANPDSRASAPASDNAGNYDTTGTSTTGFTTGSNQGSGFQPFLLTATSNAGWFVSQNNTDSQINSNSGGGTPQVFDLYGFNGGNSAVTRPFSGALSIGQSFAISIDSRGVDDGSTAGLSLTDSTGTARFTFDFLGGTNQLRVTDAAGPHFIGSNLDFSVLGDGIRVVFTLTGINTYSVTATGITQSGRSDATSGNLAGTAGVGIDRVTVFDNNAGSDHDFFFNNLAINSVPEPGPVTGIIALGVLGTLMNFRRTRRTAWQQAVG